MKVLSNNYQPKGPRKVHCTHCYSELAIVAKDVKLGANGHYYVCCPCCCKDFFVRTDAETTEAYYKK